MYNDLAFPEPPEDRPYTFINMVTTIDGKSVQGTRDETVSGLGSRRDHEAMQKIEVQADAILAGAQTLRATSLAWNPRSLTRIAVTRSGKVPEDAQFFTQGKSFLAAAENDNIKPFGKTKVLTAGKETLDFKELLRKLRREHGIRRLLITGGSEINAQFLEADLVDELFLTLAPKVKLGRDLPTYAGGDPLPKDGLLAWELIEHHVIGNEIFVRYRRA